jgi:signal peptidase II
MKVKLIYLLTTTAVLVAFDQLTKIYIQSKFFLGESIAVIEGFFNLTYVQNPGAAFGFLARSPEMFRENFFLLIPPIAMAIILYFLRSVKVTDRIQIVALSLVFGGALGNYIDRLRVRYVIDFLDFHLNHKYSYPAFNIADSAIVCGIVILFLLSFRKEPTKESGQST